MLHEIGKEEYDFLKTHELLGKGIILLGLGGSRAYGMDNEQSDYDWRGVALNSKRNILLMKDFEQIVDENTDTTIYSFNKIIKLLCACNPNTIELLGLQPEHYLFMTWAGRELINNRRLFLSKAAVNSFGGYANAQRRRMENKAARDVGQEQRERFILKSIEHAQVDYKLKYFKYPEDGIKLYVDKTERDGYDSEIFMDINLSHYPLRDYKDMWSEMHQIVMSYGKIGRRNSKAVAHNKLGKHMAHLVRLYLMAFDILERGEINTYRENDIDLLVSIRNGDYLNENGQPVQDFYDMVNSLETRLEYDKVHTELPERVDMNKIHEFVCDVNSTAFN